MKDDKVRHVTESDGVRISLRRERTSYVVRRSQGGITWAVDELHHMGKHLYTKQKTRYFPTLAEANDFKERKETDE